jgi:hypothetical protein
MVIGAGRFMYCPKCSTQNEPQQAYCRQCGQALAGVQLAVEGNTDQSLEKLNASQKWVSAGSATLITFTLIGLAIAIPGFASNNAALSDIAIINLLLGSVIGLPLIYAGKASLKRAARLLSKSQPQSGHSSLDRAQQTDRLLTKGLDADSVTTSVPGSVTEHTTLNLHEADPSQSRPR